MNMPNRPSTTFGEKKVVLSTSPISPNSKKVYEKGELNPDLRVPFREVSLASTHVNDPKTGETAIEENEPVRIYDTSGPYTDPDVEIDVRKGLDPIRRSWIMARGDVEEYEGREIRPEDDGYKSADKMTEIERFDRTGRPILRAKFGQNVSQMHYAKKGIITPEMEYIAIRENQRRIALREEYQGSDSVESILGHQHPGHSFGANLPDEITPEVGMVLSMQSPDGEMPVRIIALSAANLTFDATHPLADVDIKRANDALKNDPFIKHHKEWQDALKQMLKMGVRVEQQAFAKHGLNFVLDTYLPDKLRKAQFLP